MTKQDLRDWRHDLKADIEECDSEILDILEEIRAARQRLAEVREIRTARKATLAYVKGQIAAVATK